jgi:hypothetical protein
MSKKGPFKQYGNEENRSKSIQKLKNEERNLFLEWKIQQRKLEKKS